MGRGVISGQAAPLLQANLDTDQIMPKQFLRRVDKEGLADGVFHDLRFDSNGEPRPDFVLNQAQHAQATILLAGENFGCGSSREHAVWGLLEAGIEAIIAPSFGEIFYSNAMNNRLLLVVMAPSDIECFVSALKTTASVGSSALVEPVDSAGPTDSAEVSALASTTPSRMEPGAGPATETGAAPGSSETAGLQRGEAQSRQPQVRERQPSSDRSITIDLEQLTVSSASRSVSFTMSARHRRMFLDRTDLVEDSLSYTKQIDAFAEEYRERHPWLADSVASSMPRTGDGATRSGC